MLDTTPSNLRLEVEAAVRLRRRHTDLSHQLIERYVGSAYREDWEDEPSHENHEFEFIANMIPALVANNPKVNVKSRRPVVHRELAEAVQHGLNRWIRDINMKDRLEKPLYDSMFDFGVVSVTLEALPGYDDQDNPPMRPIFRRISPRRYFKDPQGGVEGGRYAGVILTRDRQDMIDDRNPDGSRKFDEEAVKALSSPESMDAVVDDVLRDMEIRVERNQCVYAEIYIRETGMIHTIGFASLPNEKGSRSKGGVELRKPRPFFGGPHGPFIELEYYIVPDQVYPLPPLCVTHDLVTEINSHAEQVSRDADTARNLVLYDSTNSHLGDSLANALNGAVCGIPNFDQRLFAPVTLGGANPVQLDYILRLRERIDRRSGLTDIMRGNISGQGTATEAQLAAASANARVKYMQGKVQQFVIKILENATWLLCNSTSVVYPISIDEAEEIVYRGPGAMIEGGAMFDMRKPGVREGVFMGGVQDGQDARAFYDLELIIEPYSMEAVNEAVLQKRMMEAFGITIQAAQMIPQMPYVNWPDLLDDLYNAVNVPDGRKYINFEMLAQILNTEWQPGEVRGIRGIDGAPPVNMQAFRGPPNMPAGQTAEQIQGASPKAGAGTTVDMLAGMLSQASAA